MDTCNKCEWYHRGICLGDYGIGRSLWCTLFKEIDDE